jgi:glycosyltransferase involved in cell wall biosynthesis
MPSNWLFSVVIPVRNGADTLASALDSVALQTTDKFEVIVVDDGSVDDSREIARNHPVGATVLDGSGHGTAVARNLAIARATGRFITFLDADDLWHPERLGRIKADLDTNPNTKAINTSATVFAMEADRSQLAALHPSLVKWPTLWTSSADLALAWHSLDLADINEVAHRFIRHDEVLAGPISASVTQVYDRELLISAGGFPAHARTNQDVLLNLNISRLTPIVELDDPTYFYRLRPGSAVRSISIPWPWMSGYLAARFGGLHMTTDRARGRESPIPRDLVLEDLLVRSIVRDGFDGASVPLYHMLCLLYPGRADRRAVFRRIATQLLRARTPGVDRNLRRLWSMIRFDGARGQVRAEGERSR